MTIESSLTDIEFGKYQKLIYDTCGINFTDNKKQLLISRLRKRMVSLNIDSFNKYREYVTSPKNQVEFGLMLNAISTNKTDFFRESVHFDFLNTYVYPNLQKKREILIWSAACSSGEEPYTMGITLLEFFGTLVDKKVKILGTDISTKVLDEAQAGVYSSDVVRPIPNSSLKKYFYKGYNEWDGYYLVKEPLRELVHFKRLNLMEPFPLTVLFDFIFCRNVMIYFDKPTRENLVAKLYNQLKPGGFFFIGNAESLSGLKTKFKYVQPAVYKK